MLKARISARAFSEEISKIYYTKVPIAYSQQIVQEPFPEDYELL